MNFILLLCCFCSGPATVKGRVGKDSCRSDFTRAGIVRRGLYAYQLEWWLQHFRPEQFLLVNYEQVRKRSSREGMPGNQRKLSCSIALRGLCTRIRWSDGCNATRLSSHHHQTDGAAMPPPSHSIAPAAG